MNISELGFVSQHHIPKLTEQDDLDLEVEVGARFLRQAAAACHWEPSEYKVFLSAPADRLWTIMLNKFPGLPAFLKAP